MDYPDQPSPGGPPLGPQPQDLRQADPAYHPGYLPQQPAGHHSNQPSNPHYAQPAVPVAPPYSSGRAVSSGIGTGGASMAGGIGNGPPAMLPAGQPRYPPQATGMAPPTGKI